MNILPANTATLHAPRQQSGVSMIEVLVTLVILLVGLLGLAGLMMQSQRSEIDSYGRVQALVLLQDMASRMNANRNVFYCYAFTTNVAAGTPYVGTNGTAIPVSCNPPTQPTLTGWPWPGFTNPPTAQQIAQLTYDLQAWNDELAGAGETTTTGKVGAMAGARGCISYDPTTALPELDPATGQATGNTLYGTGIYTLTVTWQGEQPTASPSTGGKGLTCAQGLYDTADLTRRAVSLTFRQARMR